MLDIARMHKATEADMRSLRGQTMIVRFYTEETSNTKGSTRNSIVKRWQAYVEHSVGIARMHKANEADMRSLCGQTMNVDITRQHVHGEKKSAHTVDSTIH